MRPTLYLTLAIVLALPSRLLAEPDPLDTVEKTSTAWIELRSAAVQLETSWQTDRTLLESTIAALEERAKAAEEEQALVLAKTAKDREEVQALVDKTHTAAAEQQAFETRLIALGQRLVRLRSALPPRLADALEVSFTSLSGTNLTPGERMQLTASALNRCAQFNRMITAGDEVLKLDGTGEARMYEVIYWGLSHGYAIDRAARKAWYGSPGSDGWRWESRDDLIEPALTLLAIHQDQHDPEFVTTPARLGRAATPATNP